MNNSVETKYGKLFDQIRHKIPKGRPLVFRLFLLAAAIFLLIWLIAMFSSSDEKKPARGSAEQGPVPVRVELARLGNMEVIYRCLGTVAPVNTVTVRSRVDGELMALHFKEGRIVAAGDLLAEIDPRPFQAQLLQAEGQLARDQALLHSAEKDLQRYQILKNQQSIAIQQYDNQKFLVEQYRGAVKLDQGQIEAIKLQLTYCRITAPIDGRLGLRRVDPGNIVQASDQNGLAVITQLQPIQALFTITDMQVPSVLAAVSVGRSLKVEAWDKEQKNLLDVGRLLTMDNMIDPATGTLRLKAEFANDKMNLFPNQFVNIRLMIDTFENVLIVPSAAVQYGNDGPYAYVVDAEKKVSLRRLLLGDEESGSMIVKEGLAPGDVVVVEGLDRLREGIAVSFNDKP